MAHHSGAPQMACQERLLLWRRADRAHEHLARGVLIRVLILALIRVLILTRG